MIKELAFDEVKNVWTCSIIGDLDIYHAPQFIDILSGAFALHPATAIFDCSKLDYIDSLGLGALVKINALVREHGSIRLCHVKPRIYKLFEITSINVLFEIEVDDATA